MKLIRAFVLALLLLVPAIGVEAAALVQQSTALDSATEPAVPQLTGVTAGNRIVTLVITREGADITSVSSDNGGALSVVFKSGATSGRRVALYELLNVASGTHNITVDLPAADANLGVVLLEVSGTATTGTGNVLGTGNVGGTAEQQNSGATSHPCATTITSPGAGMLICVAALNSNLTETVASGYTQINNGSRWWAQYKVTAGETSSGTFTTGSSGDSTAAMYFIADAAGGGGSIAPKVEHYKRLMSLVPANDDEFLMRAYK